MRKMHDTAQDGCFSMFTSNWEETAGRDMRGRAGEGVFITKLGANK
jgi:hypothetical protein